MSLCLWFNFCKRGIPIPWKGIGGLGDLIVVNLTSLPPLPKTSSEFLQGCQNLFLPQSVFPFNYQFAKSVCPGISMGQKSSSLQAVAARCMSGHEIHRCSQMHPYELLGASVWDHAFFFWALVKYFSDFSLHNLSTILYSLNSYNNNSILGLHRVASVFLSKID